MKNNMKIIMGLIIVVLVAYVAYMTNRADTMPTVVENVPESPIVKAEDIRGCYVATLAKDVYSLGIRAQDKEAVFGTLVFKNFEKDSSSGTFKGTYKDGILLATYSFNSEGMDSAMQVIFKKQGDDFVRGYGPVDKEGTHFSDLSLITYDQSQVFKASTEGCPTALLRTSEGDVAVGATKVINTVSVTFNSLVQDSRCPVDAMCIEAGAITAAVTLKVGSKTETFNMPSDEVPHVFAGYKVSIVRINPPRLSVGVPDADSYVLTFRVEKA